MSSPAVQIRSRVPRLAGSAVERARLTVVPRRRIRRPGPVRHAVSLILLGGVIGLLMFNTSMQQGVRRDRAGEPGRLAVGARADPAHGARRAARPAAGRRAAQAMGMVPAVSSPFIRLSDGKVLNPDDVDARRQLADPSKAPALPASLNPPPLIVDPPAEPGASGAEKSRGDGRNR